MSRKPAFWITLALLGLVGSLLAVRLFPLAFPLLAEDIQMDRDAALEEARVLADRFGWAPSEARQAASFGHLNPAFQTYMELEGGGLEELNRLVRDEALSLYAWRVRQFAEGVVEEGEVRFTPTGKPYGFSLRLAEDTPGNNLDEDSARDLAMAEAARDWAVDPSRWEILESSQTERPGGRIDHTFVYQRWDVGLGEATLRLRLRVAGDELVELTPFVHVPEAFQRRFQATRDVNNSISLAGTVAFLILFVLLGGGLGTILLLRERWIEWKTPLMWGGIVAGLMALSSVNSLPLAWMSYDTALSAGIYVGTLLLTAVGIFAAGTAFLAFLFMAGEGLLRRGLPEETQQWKFWSPGVVNSDPALGRTVAPYLVVGLELGYVVVFYLAMTRLAGWWSPASSLVEPDLLATYMPWLTAVSTSLFAAFSEETIFRAIPIGAAAILGRRYGRPGLWIWSTIVIQALVFAASHADYPQQPSYARVVEIFPVFLAWGVVVLYFGLVPAIIGHFTYNLVLFSLPLFVAETPGIWVDRLVVVAAGSLPLVVVVVARLRLGGVGSVPEWALNRSWRPPPPRPARERGGDAGVAPPAGAGSPGLTATGMLLVAVAALAGLLLWGTGLETGRTFRMNLNRAGAEAAARDALETRGVDLDAGWRPLLSLTASQGASHDFVWQNATEEEYRELVGRFLDPPHWRIRFVRFGVAPEERAETYTVRIGPAGDVMEVAHILPEGRPAESLGEAEARVVALAALRERLGAEPEQVREIAAAEEARPDRTDWTFVFVAREGYPLSQGEGRIEARISGSEITGARRFVHLPEEWERERRSEAGRRLLASLSVLGPLLLLGLAGTIFGVVRWAQAALHAAPIRPLALTMGSILLVTGLNEWPRNIGGFTTQESFANQLGVTILGLALGLLFMSMAIGLLGALAHTWLRERRSSVHLGVWVGLGLGVAFSGGSRALSRFAASGPPGWPGYDAVVSYVPWVSAALSPLSQFLALAAAGLILLAAMSRLLGTSQAWLAWVLPALTGLALAPNQAGAPWLIWIGAGFAVALGLVAVRVLCERLGWALLPGILAGPVLLDQAGVLLVRPFPGSAPGALLASVLVVGAAVIWGRALARPGPASS
jgi:membrane protease YdiL (CAAX protease family)